MTDTRKNIEILRKHKIGIISNDVIMVNEFTNIMDKLGVPVVSDTEIKIDILLDSDIDIILTDIPIFMTGISKYIEEILDKSPDIKILLLTNERTDSDMIQYALVKGASSYIKKPLDYIILVQKLVEYLEDP